MFAIKLTLILLVAMLYLSSSACWFFWFAPGLFMNGGTDNLIGTFAGTCIWLLITFGLIIHIINTARPIACAGK